MDFGLTNKTPQQGKTAPGTWKMPEGSSSWVHLFFPRALPCSGLGSLVWASWEGLGCLLIPARSVLFSCRLRVSFAAAVGEKSVVFSMARR